MTTFLNNSWSENEGLYSCAAVYRPMWSNIMHVAAMRKKEDDHNKNDYNKDDHNKTYNQLLEH